MTHPAPGLQESLPPHPSSVGTARRLVRAELARAGRDDLVETAELLVSEVVTNALVHAGTSVEVRAWVHGEGLRVEVDDGSPQVPTLRHNSALAGTGRGLRMLQALVDRWGALPRVHGKTVWFELSSGELESETALLGLWDGDDELPADLADLADVELLQVELLNVPLLLHLAWHQHAEALLREHLLYSLGDDPGLDELEAHASASEAISLLLRHIPDPGVGEDPDELMAAVTEPAVSSPRQLLPVSTTARAHFRVLGATLDAALALADAGAFLTPPTQPEIRAFRRWVCDEIERQGDGDLATPWADDAEWAPPVERSALGWSTAEVSSAPQALIAADDTNRIIAVSPAALTLLGYDDAAALVGRRLVVIIPPRFRQAHLAGFTLHLATGRAPLLGRAVTVPALCHDGSETAVELTVQSETLPGGRHVFVATLRR